MSVGLKPQLNMAVWQGREDTAEGAAGLRWHQAMQPWDAAQRADHTTAQRSDRLPNTGRQSRQVTLLGLQSDAGVIRNQGRPGAAQGPEAIRRALANLPLPHGLNLADAGDIVCPSVAACADNLEQAQQAFAQHLAAVLGRGDFPIALGGGHEIAYASFSGLARRLQSSHSETRQAQTSASEPSRTAHLRVPRIGIINFDAHFDLRRDQRPSSGTPFLQIAEDCHRWGWPFHYACLGVSDFANTRALFDRADELNVLWRKDEQIIWPMLDDIVHSLNHFIAEVDQVYLTLCLDVLPAAVAPGVSAPAARGVTLDLVEVLLDRILASGKVALADIAEMNPAYDIDQRTARVAARVVARIAARIANSVGGVSHHTAGYG